MDWFQRNGWLGGMWVCNEFHYQSRRCDQSRNGHHGEDRRQTQACELRYHKGTGDAAEPAKAKHPGNAGRAPLCWVEPGCQGWQ